MNTAFVREDGRFVPASTPEFSERAKRLARLLDLPLQTSQEALARIYGFATLHEVQQVIKAKEVAGPYAEDLLSIEWEPRGAGLFGVAMSADVARKKRLYAVLLEVMDEGPDEDRRVSDAAEAGLFSRPPAHRKEFHRVLAKQAVRYGSVAGGRHPSEYARYVTRPDGEGYFEFTALGQSVADVLSDLGMESVSDYAGYAAELNLLNAGHPSNPWVRTEWLQHHCVASWQGGWADYLHSEHPVGYPTEDAERRFQTSGADARHWYEEARKTIALYQDLIRAPSTGVRQPHSASLNSDDASFLQALYWGGRTALQLGLYGVAKRWLGRCLTADKRDAMGARYYHSVAALLGGYGRPRGRRPVEQHDVWAWMQELAWDLKARDFVRATQSLEQALSFSPHVIRAVDGKFTGANNLRVHSNHDTLAHVQEFMFATREFWAADNTAREWLHRMTKDWKVRAATVAYHRASLACFGAAHMEPAVAAKRRNAKALTREALADAVERASYEEGSPPAES